MYRRTITLSYIVSTNHKSRLRIPRWRFGDTALPENLVDRGFDGLEMLDEYPYRDDGKLVWQALYDYVTQYLKTYYRGTELGGLGVYIGLITEHTSG